MSSCNLSAYTDAMGSTESNADSLGSYLRNLVTIITLISTHTGE